MLLGSSLCFSNNYVLYFFAENKRDCGGKGFSFFPKVKLYKLFEGVR